MEEEGNDIRIPILDYALAKNHRIRGDVCVCTAGPRKCEGVPSLWDKDFYSTLIRYDLARNDDEAYALLRGERKLFSQIDNLKNNGVLKEKGRIYYCIPQDMVDQAAEAVGENKIELLIKMPDIQEAEEEIEEEVVEGPRGEKIKVPFRRVSVAQERSPRWEVQFAREFWEGVEGIWEKTLSSDREHQMALCLSGLDIIGGGQIVGNPGNVEALDRDLSCPDDSVRIGSIHTHPPDAQFLLEKGGLSKSEVEQTMMHSIPDMSIMIKFNDLADCVKSERSTTCMINRSDYLPRVLFRDMVVGQAPYAGDKTKLMGEMTKRGIQKHRRVEGAVTVDYPNKIVCGPEGNKMKCKPDRITADSPEQEIKTRFQDIHTFGLEVAPKFDKKNMVMEYEISPYANEQASCWVGYDGYIWCDGHESMSKIGLSKKALQPLYEKRIWDVINKDLKPRLDESPLWSLLEHYHRVLSSSPDEGDQKKARLVKGSMEAYKEDGDANQFARTILSLISIV